MDDVIEEAEADVEQQQQQQQPRRTHSVVLRDFDDDGGGGGDWYELHPPPVSRHRSISYRGGGGGGSERSSRRHQRKKKSAWQKFKDFVRVVFSYVFSSVGICVLVMVYLFLGAYAFMAIEGEAEAEDSTTFAVAAYRKRFVRRLWVVTERLNTLHPGNWSQEVAAQVSRFQADFLAQVGDGYAGQDKPTPKWSYSGSLLYAITVITTIGYGHISPSTVAGKIFTMVYALIGMPLFLLYLANIGDILAKAFKWTYSTCCRLRQQRQQRKSGSARQAHFRTDDGDQVFEIPYPSDECDEEDAEETDDGRDDDEVPAVRLMVTHEDAGNGRTRPKSSASSSSSSSDNQVVMIRRRLSDGEGVEDEEIEVDEEEDEEEEETLSGVDYYYDDGRALSGSSSPSSGGSSSSDGGGGAQKEKLSHLTVPVSLSLVVMVSYIILGAFLFAAWEQWSVLDGFYFCFITLSTIGFGDFVPGSSFDKGSDDDGDGAAGVADLINPQFIFCTIYILLGMAVIAMCFNLMQEKVVQNVTSFGKKLGIIGEEH